MRLCERTAASRPSDQAATNRALCGVHKHTNAERLACDTSRRPDRASQINGQRYVGPVAATADLDVRTCLFAASVRPRRHLFTTQRVRRKSPLAMHLGAAATAEAQTGFGRVCGLSDMKRGTKMFRVATESDCDSHRTDVYAMPDGDATAGPEARATSSRSHSLAVRERRTRRCGARPPAAGPVSWPSGAPLAPSSAAETF